MNKRSSAKVAAMADAASSSLVCSIAAEARLLGSASLGSSSRYLERRGAADRLLERPDLEVARSRFGGSK